MEKVCAIVLAAGKGTRMGVNKPKALIKIAGKSILIRCLNSLKQSGISDIIVVVGYKAQDIIKEIDQEKISNITFVHQEQLLGTANSLEVALKSVPKKDDTLLVLFGDDSAFFSTNTLKEFINTHIKKNNLITFLVSYLKKPNPIGGLEIDNDGHVIGILRQSQIIKNGLKKYPVLVGSFCFDKRWITKNISKIEKSDLSGEYPLPYIYKVALENNESTDTYQLVNENEWFGINTPKELSKARYMAGRNK